MTLQIGGSVGCTCKTCPVHAPKCPSCGSSGPHFCPGPKYPNPGPYVSPYQPHWHTQPHSITVNTNGGNPRHIAKAVEQALYKDVKSSTASAPEAHHNHD